MGLDRVEIQFWDLELEYQLFQPESQPDFRAYRETQWVEAIKDGDLASTFNFFWALRSLLWPELIRDENLEVRFLHDGVSGSGSGPFLYFGDSSKVKELPTKDLMRASDGLLLESAYFPFSDLFMSDHYEGMGFFGIDTLQVDFISYEELGSDGDEDSFEILFENTFSADFRIEAQEQSSTSWSALSEADQVEVIQSLVDIATIQLDEFDEYIQDPSDVLACVVTASSTATLAKQKVLSQLEELKFRHLLDFC